MNSIPREGVNRLPAPLRLWLARRELARQARARQQDPLRRLLLAAGQLVLIIALSALLGYEFARQSLTDLTPELAAAVPRSGVEPNTAANSSGDDDAAKASVSRIMDSIVPENTNLSVLAPELGRLQSEILRLRVLFKRLAAVAELDDGEFDIDYTPTISPEKALDTGEPPMETDPAVRTAAEEDWSSVDTVAPLRQLKVSIAELDHISRQSERMASIFLERSSAHERRIAGWPVADGRVSSYYGYRIHPVSGVRQLHRGMDFIAPTGSPVLALADGVVTFAGLNGGYGNLVELDHGDGYRTRYAHNASSLVQVGQRVERGEAIATLGSTGRSTGPHVHVEVRHFGRPLDPAKFLR